MNGAHLHLLINHVPIIGLIFGGVLILGGMIRKNPEISRAGIVTLAITALIAIGVFLTGEPAEEVVEHLAGRSEEILERHEDAALWALIGIEGLGALAVLGLIAYRRPRVVPAGFMALLLFLSLVVGSWVGWTSHLGGQITHSEARPGFDAAAAEGESSSETGDH